MPAVRLIRTEGDREADVGGWRAEEAGHGGRKVAQWETFGGVGRSGQDGCRSKESDEEGEEGGGMPVFWFFFFCFFFFWWLVFWVFFFFFCFVFLFFFFFFFFFLLVWL